MKIKEEFKILVIVGSWNRAIFQKDWIKRFLLPNEDFLLEFSLNLDGSHRISTNNIRIEFHNNRLNFIPIKNDINTYELISEIAFKIADYLPHTPVIGYGVNFIFEGKSQDIKHDLIKTYDTDKLLDYKATIINSEHKHSIHLDNVSCNFSISLNNDKLIFGFNFHTDIKDLVQFKEKLDEKPITKLNEIALGIMDNVYNIQPDGEHNLCL